MALHDLKTVELLQIIETIPVHKINLSDLTLDLLGKEKVVEDASSLPQNDFEQALRPQLRHRVSLTNLVE